MLSCGGGESPESSHSIFYPKMYTYKRAVLVEFSIQKRYSAKETYDSIDSTDRSHPIDYPRVPGYVELRVPKKALPLSKDP